MNSLSRKRALALVIAGLCSPLSGIHAQTTESDEEAEALKTRPKMEEVVVSAQRREQNLMDVPIAINAVSGEQIQFEGIEDVQRLAEEIPALVVGGQSSSTGTVSLSIRGLGSVSGDPAVGYYIDEVYQASATGFVTQFIDVERVEVLKGPQGTLWGRNTTAGAVHYVTKKPHTRAFEAEAYAEVGFYDSLDWDEFPIRKLGGALNVPLGETFSMRVSAAKVEQDNFTYNTELGGTQLNQDALTARADFLWEPTEQFSAIFGVSYIDDPFHNAFTTKTDPYFEGSSILYMLNLVTDVTVEDGTWEVNANAEPRAEFEETGLRLGLDFDFNEALTLRSISATKSQDTDRFGDLDGTLFTLVHNDTTTSHDWWSQELQLLYNNDTFNGIIGLYYFDEDREFFANTTANYAEYLPSSCNNGNTDNNPAFAGLCPVVNAFILPFMSVFNGGQPFVLADFQPGGLWDTTLAALGLGAFGINAGLVPVSGSGQESANDSFAVYMQGSAEIVDTLSLTAGIRWTKDEKDITGYNWNPTNGFFFNPAASGVVTDEDVTPKVGLEWRPTDDAMYYASYTQGFKSGALNIYGGIVEGAVPNIDPETISAYELGVKQAFAEGKFILDASAYYYDYNDYQLSIQYLTGPQLTNLPKVTVKGVEAGVQFIPVDALILGASFNYVDSSIDSDLIIQDPFNLDIPAQNVRGQPLPRSPEFKGSLTADYTFDQVFGNSSIVVGGALNYSDDFNHDLHGTFTGGGYTSLNANARWVSPTGSWWVNLYGRNLTNEEYQTSSVFADSIGEVLFFNPPRTIGLQVGYNYN
jgi:iron complex outermembrane receptor protein